MSYSTKMDWRGGVPIFDIARIGVLTDVLSVHRLPHRDRSAGIGEGKIALERFMGSSLSRTSARQFRYERPIFGIRS